MALYVEYLLSSREPGLSIAYENVGCTLVASNRICTASDIEQDLSKWIASRRARKGPALLSYGKGVLILHTLFGFSFRPP